MHIFPVPGVIHGVEGGDDAAVGLRQGAQEEHIRVIGDEAVHLQDLDGHGHIGGVTPAVPVGVAGGQHGALVGVGGLDDIAVTGLVLVLPVFAHLHDAAAKLMAHDGGVGGHIIGHPGMVGAQHRGFVAAHAQGIGHHLADDRIIGHGGKLKLLQAQVFFAIQANSFGFHIQSPPFSCLISFQVLSIKLEKRSSFIFSMTKR